MNGDRPLIRPALTADVAAISAIYNHYVEHSTATLAEVPETVAERGAWLAAHHGAHRVLVAEAAGEVVGWASLSPFHPRSAFRFTAEDSVYLREDQRGRGLGTRLLDDLLAGARADGFHSVVAVITAEQQVSVALHRRLGFLPAGELRAAGRKFDRWLDVVYLQLLLG